MKFLKLMISIRNYVKVLYIIITSVSQYKLLEVCKIKLPLKQIIFSWEYFSLSVKVTTWRSCETFRNVLRNCSRAIGMEVYQFVPTRFSRNMHLFSDCTNLATARKFEVMFPEGCCLYSYLCIWCYITRQNTSDFHAMSIGFKGN